MGARTSIENVLKEKGNGVAPEIAKRVLKDRSLLGEVVEAAESSTKRVKNAAAKTLKIVSEQDPSALYARFDFFASKLEVEDSILKWIAMDVLGNLAAVDSGSRLNQGILRRFFSHLEAKELVTAAHAVDNLGKIAACKPRCRKAITENLLRADVVERSRDCRSILAGKVIVAFSEYFDRLKPGPLRAGIISYADAHANDPRGATKRKAEAFLKKAR
jgi:hypothetical protein